MDNRKGYFSGWQELGHPQGICISLADTYALHMTNAVRHTVRLSPYVVYLRKYTPCAYISYVIQDWFWLRDHKSDFTFERVIL